MATPALGIVLEHVRRSMLRNNEAGLTDGMLLESFITHRDQAAFEVLVRRHGSMVLGVCRRILRNEADAEDAFQATFLVLVRKASSIRPGGMVGNWLYGVAHNTARKARAMNTRMRAREREAGARPMAEATPEDWQQQQALLDQELQALPDKYRAAIVLCDLEGKSIKEAARHLGCPPGTIGTRLARGRSLLARRLACRGLTWASGAIATVLSQNAASATLRPSLVASTVKASHLFAAGQAASGVVGARVAALTEGVLKAMLLTKLKLATVVLLAVGVLGSGAAVLTRRTLAQKPTDKAVKNEGKRVSVEVRGVVKAVDASHNTVTIHLSKELVGEKTFVLARDAAILLDDGTGDKLGFQQGKLADLAEGVSITLRLSRDQKEVARIWAEGPTVQGTLKAADAGNHTITATVVVTKGEPALDKTFAVAEYARLFIDDGKVKDKSKPSKEPSLADLPANAVVFLKLSADRKVVGSIRAEGQSVTGVVKAVDSGQNTITVIVVTGTKGERGVDKNFPVAKNAQVSIDDGKLKDKSKPDNLGDVPSGSIVTLRLSLDEQSVVAIRAEGATLYGAVKAVDAGNNTITVSDKVDGDKTYPVMKDAVVFLDGQSGVKKLGDVPVEAAVNLKLLADQKTVREIWAYGPTVPGTVKGKAENESITIADKEGEKTLALVKDVRILIDESKEGKLTDLIDGTVAQLRLSADKSAVLEIRAEGPSFRGTVKAIDADKNTITLTIGAKNGMGGEDKEFRTAKDTAVVTEINGVSLKLTDLRVDKEVVLRLSIDQKAAARITVLGE